MEENKKFRNHISIIIEQIGGGIVALAVVAFSILVQNVEELAGTDFSFLQGRALFVLLIVAAVLAVFV